MRRRLPLLFLICILSSQLLTAQVVADTNIVITDAKESFEYVFNNKTNSVEVNEVLELSYRCTEYKAEQPVSEFYNNQVSIDDIDITSDGRKLKSVVPKCDFFSVGDVFYSDMRICYFMMPFYKKGDNGKVVFRKTVKDPRYFTSIFFREPLKVANKQVQITIPRWMKAEFREYNFDGYDISKKTTFDPNKDADVITYSMKDLAAQPHEDYAPGPTYVEPHLLVLNKSAEVNSVKTIFFATLGDQYAWYRSLISGLENNDAVVKSKAIEITGKLSADIEKIKAIFYWVQNNIRYIAFEDGVAGFKPEQAGEVLRKKYGDCKGMANLTKELLKSLGFDSRLCWIGTNHIAYDYSTPALSVDNHMICGLNFKNNIYFLDATENYIGLGEYAERIQGRQVLMEDGNNYKLLNVPATTYLQNTDAEKRELSINGNDIKGKVERVWKGEEKEYLLTQLNSIKKDRANDAFIKYLGNKNADMQITDFKTSDLNNFDKDVTANYEYTYRNAVSSFGKEMYVDIDFRKELNDFLFKNNERANDYWFNAKSEIIRETVLNIPDGYTLTSMPKNLSVKNDNLEIEINFVPQPGKLLYKKRLIIKNTRLSKKMFAKWNNDIEKLQSLYNEQVVLTGK